MSNRPPHEPDDELDPFAPGESFADGSAESADTADALPSWLQSFGDTVTTDSPSAAEQLSSPGTTDLDGLPRPDFGMPGNDEAAESSMAGWLDEASVAPLPHTPLSHAAPADPGNMVSGADDGIGFFSDDDLPEWLRSLGPSSAPVSGAARVAPAAAPADIATLTIPAVSRVWVTPHEAAPVPPSASLFASIAGAIDERPDTRVSEFPSGSAPPLSTMPVEQPVVASATIARVERPQEGRWSRKALWLVVTFMFLSVVMLWIVLQLQG